VLAHVALLRGINVGGRNKLAMKDLVSMFADAGCGRVRTYIQSGNVLFDATPGLARKMGTLAAASIRERCGLDIPVITRTIEELADVVENNPFSEAKTDPKLLGVGFLAQRPSVVKLAALDHQRSPPDELVVCGREFYMHCPNGVARSRFTSAYLDSTLGTICTMRNWRTTLKLLELGTD
jgi:uncharacterized protein (DUF1697 family)